MNKIRKVYAKSRHKNDVGEMVLSPAMGIHGKGVAKLGFSQGDEVYICGTSGLIVIKKLACSEFSTMESLIPYLANCLSQIHNDNPHFKEGLELGIKISNIARKVTRI